MNTNDTQQEHIYNERIQEFFPLFDKKDDPIYNARVGFNTVKFLTEHANWDWNKDENKDKACEVILQECNKIKKAEQKLESEVKKRLKDYVDDGVTAVSIYGNYASITLGDNKKEFKISEFLNSDFCQKNGISGFSTLHSDGKSGMHGFVAEEGGKKIRHYVVTDGSYEMTLKWYGEKGEEYKIKINIKADGVEFIEGNITEKDLKDELKMNKDVKIGGLFLHEIKFREKGQGKANEMQKDNQVLKESSEIAIKSNSRDIEQEVKKPVQKHQATHMNREVGSQTPPLPPLRTSSLPPEKDVFNKQGRNTSAKPVSQDGGQRDKQNNPTPNNQQKGATSDPSDSSTFTKSVSHNQDNRQEDERYDNPTFGHAVPGSRKPDRSEQIPNNQQQPEIPQQEGNSKSDLLQEIRNFKKNNLRHTDVDDREASMEGGRKNESTSSILETLKDKVPYLPYSNIHEHNSDNRGASDAEWEESKQPLSAPKPNRGVSSPTADHSQSQADPKHLTRKLEENELNHQKENKAPEEHGKNSKDHNSGTHNNYRRINEDVKETSFNTSEKIQSELQKDDLADVKTVEGPTVSVSASTPNSISDSGYISPTNGDNKSQTDLKQVGRKLEEHINLTPFEELKNTLGQENLGLKPADQSQISEETKKRLREIGLLKDSSTDIKTNDSGYSSPTHANHEQSQVNPGQLKASLMNVEQRDDTLLTEFTSKLDKETQKFPLKPVDQKEMSEQTKERLSEAGLLKDGLANVKTVAEQENNDTNSTVDKNSNLYKLLEKDEAQLKIGVIEEERKDTLTEHTDSYDRNRIALGNRNKRPLDWAKRIAESQEKDTNKSILM
ncbi:hypothetical protein [Wolbachia endosymbiont (group A) of Pogonocherus hispidulus]|uniref:hypothetical protein n=1 Tax=Wolbachia endosymbiont (group A) of Pogonocherus hispidulus TaxID=3066136 RepID=UPI00334174E4